MTMTFHLTCAKFLLNDREKIKNTKDILEKQKNLYSDLYSQKTVDDKNTVDSTMKNFFPKLCTGKLQELARPITYEDRTHEYF